MDESFPFLPFDAEEVSWFQSGGVKPTPNVRAVLGKYGTECVLGDLDGNVIPGRILAEGALSPAIELFACHRRWWPEAHRAFADSSDYRWFSFDLGALYRVLETVWKTAPGLPVMALDKEIGPESLIKIKRITYVGKLWQINSNPGSRVAVAFDKETKTWAVWEGA